MTDSHQKFDFPLHHYRLEFNHSGRAPYFAGNAWRGALGYALRRASCLTGARECTGCPLLHQCAYAYLFATPIPPDASTMRRYTEAPHPYVLYEPTAEDDGVALHLTLIGHAHRHRDLMLHVLHRAASQAPGVAGRIMAPHAIKVWDENTTDWQTVERSHGGVALHTQAKTPTCPPSPREAIILQLQTPLRVRRQGQHVGANDLTFGDLFANLLRRIALLKVFHTDTQLEVDFRSLTQASREFPLFDKQLRWVDLERHSKRQNADMRLGGLLGTLHLPADGLAPFWPFLWLGQHIHAGRATTMGLGRYRIVSAGAESFPPLP